MLIALLTGFVLLMAYGKFRGFGWKALLKMAASNVSAARNIAIVMLMVGALTALWRTCGTVAYIVDLASGALTPALFLPGAFLLCAAISVLTGTSVGTAATMGVICMSVGNAIGVNSAICGGAILAGSYFGDRCSPVSTSALLVAEITKTNLYDNIRGMIRTGWIAALVTFAIYGALGFFAGNGENAISTSTANATTSDFDLRWFMALPAISILALALFRIDVKINMLVSIAISVVVGFVVGLPVTKIASAAGYGILSMLKLIIVVIISLTYAGLFRGTGILEKLHAGITHLSKKVSPFGCVVLTAIATCALACNQTLSIVLTNEICTGVMPDEKRRAIAIENTSVIIAPLVPWTVASLVPLGAIGAPTSSILFACFLYLVPLLSRRYYRS
ncbi:MAG: hypothetical protein MJY93_07430 [Fibrobacter sp.]|nr:hypothetical protein [Fibrobacter sp.]